MGNSRGSGASRALNTDERSMNMAKKALNFKSKAAKNRWMAYGHVSGVFARTPGNTPIKIRGKSVKVNHSVRRKKK